MRKAGVRIDTILSEGPGGGTYLATDLETDRPCVLKVLNTVAVPIEAQILAAMDSRHIPRLWRVVSLPSQVALVMERAAGRALSDLLDPAPLGRADALAMTEELAVALRAVHAAGFLHLDVKPANVVVAMDPHRATLVDFGSAARRPSHTPSSFSGTPAYAAPELFREGFELCAATDVYGLGCTLFHALMGRPPFAGHSRAELRAQHLRADVPTCGDPAIDNLLAGMLAKRSDARYETMVQVHSALKQIQ